MHKLIHKIKNFVVSLRFSILSIFITLFISTVLFLIAFVTLRFEKLLEYTSFSLMNQVSLTVLEDVESEIDPVRVQSEFTSELIEHGVFDPDKENQIVNYTFEILKILPIVQGVVWGDEHGDFIVSYKDEDGTITTEIYDRLANPPIHEIHKRNHEGIIIKKIKSNDFSYDPRTRPWYIYAKQQRQSVWTDVIKLQVISRLALTVATPIFNKDGSLRGVFGLGISLEDLVNFMSNQKVSENGFSFIVTTDGKLMVLPNKESPYNVTNKNIIYDIHTISKPALAKSLDQYNATGQENFTLYDNGNKYLFSYRKIPTLSNYNWLIGVIIPQGDFTRNIEEINLITILDCLIVLIIGIFIVSKFVNKIVYPIKSLVREAAKIKQFDLSSNLHIPSRIKEVINLVDSFQALKQGLKSFQKYVPKTLVNQLIETREDSRVGGLRKELTIFFSDIENFTSIAESMNPNQLMIYLCEYLEEITKIVSDNHGTIDKYIGDAVMAFWGAPLIEEKSEKFAAKAALECQKRLSQLNARWKTEDRLPLITRIGLHKGEAIVGNVGSSERFNYTAIGDTINIASRLEKLNKIYHTNIIVSEAIYKKIKSSFVLRMIDCVMLKGKMHSTHIYELICENKNEIGFDIDRYQDIFSLAFSAYQLQSWDKAIEGFKECLKIYPEDTISPIFIKRCNHLKNHPPTQWDGIWKIVE